MSCLDKIIETIYYFTRLPALAPTVKMSSLKRTRQTALTCQRKTKKVKVEDLPEFPFFHPDQRNVADIIFNYLPIRDQASIALTCKSSLPFLPEKELFPKTYEIYSPETTSEDFVARPYDTLIIDNAFFPGGEYIKKRFGKVKHVVIYKDLVEVGMNDLFPIENLCALVPNLETLDIHSCEKLMIHGPKESIKKIRIYSDNNNMIEKQPIGIILYHSLEELYISAHKDTGIFLMHSNDPEHERVKIKTLHGQCRLTREYGEGYAKMKHGGGIRENQMILVKGKKYSV